MAAIRADRSNSAARTSPIFGMAAFCDCSASVSDRRRLPRAVAKTCIATTAAAIQSSNAVRPFVEAIAPSNAQTTVTKSKSCRRRKRKSGTSAGDVRSDETDGKSARCSAAAVFISTDAMARALLIPPPNRASRQLARQSELPVPVPIECEGRDGETGERHHQCDNRGHGPRRRDK